MNKESNKKNLNSYKENGYLIIKKFISKENCMKLNEILDSLPPKKFIPYSNVPWGFGNLLENKDIEKIIPLKKVFKNVTPLMNNESLKCNHIMAVNKAEFIGPDVEWHQEFLNINVYAPGYDFSSDLDNFIQIFIALDKHLEDNGPLMVFEGSHKDGILEHEDIINSNIGHKRRIKYDDLKNLSKRRKLVKLLLEEGDAVFFNHLIVHGSPTNTSFNRRRALLYQIRNECKQRDNEKFIKDTLYRTTFIKDQCKKIIKKLDFENPYKDFNK